MEIWEVRQVPSDYARLMMFLDMAEHYLRACDDIPLPEGSNKFKITLNQEPLSTALELRLMLLRKFVETSGHRNVTLKRVAESFRQCYAGPSDVLNENIDSFVAAVQKVMSGDIGFSFDGEPQQVHVDHFFSVLYGSLLHADWGKWRRLKDASGVGWNMSVYTIYSTLDELLRKIHFSIKEAMTQGQLEDKSTPLQEMPSSAPVPDEHN